MSDPRVSSCGECASSEGCSEHRLFTCASCGKRVSWSDAADDESPNDCSGCWLKRAAQHMSCPYFECTLRGVCTRVPCIGTYPKLASGQVLDALGQEVSSKVATADLDVKDVGSSMSETALIEAIVSAPPRTFGEQVHRPGALPGGGLGPSVDTLSQVPRSWPPNTGCDPGAPVEAPGDQGPPVDLQVVTGAAERVRSVVEGAVLATLASEGVPEISVGASYRLASRLGISAAEQFVTGLLQALRGDRGQL